MFVVYIKLKKIYKKNFHLKIGLSIKVNTDNKVYKQKNKRKIHIT